MMADYFVDNEAEEFFGKIRIEFCVLGKAAQASDLMLFASGISRRQAVCGFVTSDGLRHFEAFGQHEHQRCIDIIDTVAKLLQLRIGHAALPVLHLP